MMILGAIGFILGMSYIFLRIYFNSKRIDHLDELQEKINELTQLEYETQKLRKEIISNKDNLKEDFERDFSKIRDQIYSLKTDLSHTNLKTNLSEAEKAVNKVNRALIKQGRGIVKKKTAKPFKQVTKDPVPTHCPITKEQFTKDNPPIRADWYHKAIHKKHGYKYISKDGANYLNSK